MRKTMLSALVIGASVFTVSAFAQANLGGAARVDAGVHAGTAVQGVTHAAEQAGARTERTLHRTDAQRHTRKARSTVDDSASTHANANADGAIGADAGGAHAGASARVDAGAGLDTAATAGKAGEMGQGVGGDVRDAAHSAIQSSDRAAGSVGDAVKGVNASGNAGVSGSASTHGH